MDEDNVPQTPPDDDRTPTQEDTASASKGGDGWVMPEPVFRKSSGYLPKGFEQHVRAAVAAEPAREPSELADEISEPAPVPPSEADEDGFDEQPDITEEPAAVGAMAAPVLETTPVPPKKRRAFFRWLLMIVGVLLAVGAVATLIAIGIFWYFFQSSPSQNF
ncbi:MAG TPA: hypothetical protein VGJ02_09860 [Pyrinomonadaceae bacterium]|jgi:hypothetical protein